MIKSMTAFGHGRASRGVGFWLLELKSVNSKFLDYQMRMPASLNALEDRIKKYVAARLNRGRVSIYLALHGATESGSVLTLNLPLLAEYKKISEQLAAELPGWEKPGLGVLLNNRDLVMAEEGSPDMEQLWLEIMPAFDQALDEACAMRAAEGRHLAYDIGERLAALEDMAQQVASVSPQIVLSYQKRLQERVAKLLDGVEANPERLAQEVALMADRCDISEELVRFRSHLAQFRKFLLSDQPVGRKLDFLVQELNREANTMGSKSPDADALNLVVGIKAEIERIREQVQNIE